MSTGGGVQLVADDHPRSPTATRPGSARQGVRNQPHRAGALLKKEGHEPLPPAKGPAVRIGAASLSRRSRDGDAGRSLLLMNTRPAEDAQTGHQGGHDVGRQPPTVASSGPHHLPPVPCRLAHAERVRPGWPAARPRPSVGRTPFGTRSMVRVDLSIGWWLRSTGDDRGDIICP